MLQCTPSELGAMNLRYSEMDYLTKYIGKRDERQAKRLGIEVANSVARMLKGN